MSSPLRADLRAAATAPAVTATEASSGTGMSRPAWHERLESEARRSALGHAREGIDVMIFPRSQRPHVPPFLIGRVQWDNWLLLQAISSPGVLSVEASAVMLAVHLNHGAFKASHKVNGTLYNKKLAVFLPHPYVKETKVRALSVVKLVTVGIICIFSVCT